MGPVRRVLAMMLACATVPAVLPGQDPVTQGPAAGEAAKPPAASGTEPLPMIRGQLISRYWLRWIGNQSDQDLYETLSLDIGDPDKHAVTGYLQGRLGIDLDGHTGSQPFASLDDSYDGNPTAHLYYAYADFHHVPGFSLVRLGRQSIHDTPELAFLDGLRAETETFWGIEAQLGLYGGVSTHLYEASISGDWMMGVYAQARPWTGGRLRLDWMHLEDEALLGAHNNDLFAAGVWQSVGSFELEGQYSRLEDEDRDVRGRVTFNQPEVDLMLQVSWYQLLHTQNDLVLELDPFFSATQALFPYSQLGLLASKGLWEHLDLRFGADIRRVRDAADQGTFNHDYQRLFGTLALHDAVVKGLTLSATGDWWDGNGEDIDTWGADADYKVNDALSVSGGSYYSLYKFDLQLNEEIDHVRTYYARTRYKHSKQLTFDLAFELEDNDLDQYYTLRMGATWKF
jgi:hypothetical protein